MTCRTASKVPSVGSSKPGPLSLNLKPDMLFWFTMFTLVEIALDFC
jgi:hypothetical protein